ncbi:MAG: class D sortase [Clostridiales bacterium]|nr:class D sortase [Clostridiales bacterium]MBR5058589.1 class D sortase [Clostridiales bacterium]
MSSSRKALLFILIFWIASVIAIVGFLVFHQVRKETAEKKREDKIDQMASEIREGAETFLVDADSLPVSGEEDEVFGYTNGTIATEAEESEAASSVGSSSSGNSTYTLTSYGTISIPSIDLELPVWDGAGIVDLRYGAGRMPLSCEAGCQGNLVIFGHRMRRYGSIFNRLGEVAIGDSITITRNGSTFTYIVDETVTIDPSEISSYISREGEGNASTITLITCTPIGVGSQRLLVIGHLQGS